MNNRFAVTVGFSVMLIAALLATADATEANQGGYDHQLETGAGVRGSKKSGGKKAQDSVPIAKCIADIDAAARTNKQRTVSIIVINTDVAASTLEKQKARTGFSFGEIYVAHSLALATHQKFDAIAKLKLSGKTWEQIAREHNVTLKGSGELLRQIRENR